MIDIIVLSFNQWKYTIECIHSLQKLDTPNYRVIVVDNGSTDGSVEKIKEQFGDTITLLCNSVNLGFTGGNNIGIRYSLESGAEYILLLNNDTIVDRDFLNVLINAIKDDRLIVAANPKIYFLDEQNKIWAAGGNLSMKWGIAGNRGRGQLDRGQFDHREEVDYGTGCCLLIKSESFKSVGLLNESYFAYFEDADWSLRAKEKGFKILYVPEAKIWHAAGSSSQGPRTARGRTSPKVYYLTARNHLWFLRVHAQGWIRVTAITGYLVHRIAFYSVIFLLLGRFEKLKALWRGFREGTGLIPNPEKETGLRAVMERDWRS